MLVAQAVSREIMAEDKFDLIVLGGGVTGIGTALAARRLGLSCLLIERGTLCGATSANSLRIIHGGLRYLQTLNFRRSYSSIRAQTEICRDYAEFVEPLPCLMPLDRFGLKSKIPVSIGLGLFRALGFFAGSAVPLPRIIDPVQAENLAPCLGGKTPHGALLWHDALIRDLEGLTARIAADAKSLGAVLLTETEVVGVEKDSEFRVRAANGASWTAKAVVDARGPWAEVKSESGWCLGFNVILKKKLCAEAAFSIKSSAGRLFFAAPRNSGTALGTEYVPAPGPSHFRKLVPGDMEIRSFIAEFNAALPGVNIAVEDVIDVDAGILPRSSARGRIEPAGEEKVYNDSGLISLLSTKYTTFLNLGRAAAKKAASYCG